MRTKEFMEKLQKNFLRRTPQKCCSHAQFYSRLYMCNCLPLKIWVWSVANIISVSDGNFSRSQFAPPCVIFFRPIKKRDGDKVQYSNPYAGRDWEEICFLPVLPRTPCPDNYHYIYAYIYIQHAKRIMCYSVFPRIRVIFLICTTFKEIITSLILLFNVLNIFDYIL